MKRLTFFKLLALVACLSSALSASAYDFIYNGIYYTITDATNKTVEVAYSGDHDYSGSVTVPSIAVNNYTTYTVTGIGFRAFQYCSNLTSISLPSTLTYIGSLAFSCCYNLTSITIPNAVTTIDSSAFSSCTGLTSITIPNSVTTINADAFYNCTGLQTIDLGSGLTSIGAGAFENAGFHYNGVLYNLNIISRSITPPTIKSTTFPSDFYEKAYLTIPSPFAWYAYITEDYWEQFNTNHFSYLQPYDFKTGSIYYLASWMAGTAKVTNKNGGVLSSDNITSYTGDVTIPATVTWIDDPYFNSRNVTAIGTHAFDETRLMNKNNPGEERGTQGDLKSVVMGNYVTTIEDYAFTNAIDLRCVMLGSGVTSIGQYAFSGCEYLWGVISKNTTPPTIQSNTFDNDLYSYTTIYVPTAAAVNSYKAANYWKNFTKIEVIPTLTEALTNGGIQFTSTGSYPWMVMVDADRLYARSGNAGIHNSTSSLTATVNVPYGGTLTFDYKAWGEGSGSYIYDQCIFLVDGTEKFRYGALDNIWYMDEADTYTVELSAGSHTLEWRYTKDGSVNPTGDYFAIDNVKLIDKGAYACYTSSNTTLTFYYDNLRNSRPGAIYDLNDAFVAPAWMYDNLNVTKVVFDQSFANARPISTRAWFSSMSNLTSISGMNYLNTVNVKDMSSMFYGCSKLNSIDLRGFNTANVTNMYWLFRGCSQLNSIDLSRFNTAKVKDMTCMFYGCSKLTTIYAGSGWNTAAVTSSGNMFYNCTKLVGGQGTTYSSSHVDKAYAHIDGGPSNPGYFTASVQHGDVDGNGVIGMDDLTALINYLVYGTTSGINMTGADVDGNGTVGMDDLTALINYLVYGHF